MSYVICEFCGLEFKKKKSQIILYPRNYCSSHCAHQGRKNGKYILCSLCGAEAYKSSRDLKRSKSGEHFCCKACLLRSLHIKYKGKSNLKSGKYAAYREKLIKTSSLKSLCFLCKEKDLRILAVHHIDKNRMNNEMKNLTWLCHNCHYLVHHYKEEEKNFNNKLYDKKM